MLTDGMDHDLDDGHLVVGNGFWPDVVAPIINHVKRSAAAGHLKLRHHDILLCGESLPLRLQPGRGWLWANERLERVLIFCP